MTRALSVLIVEDSETDCQLVLRALVRGGFAPVHTRVADLDGLTRALAAGPWDVVISDYRLPTLRCEEALRQVRGDGTDRPFLVVSGAIGEETAADLMRQGVHDFVSKDNLARLAPAITRELRDAHERRARRQAHRALRESEAKYRLLAENAADVIWTLDPQLAITYVSPSVIRLTGFAPADVIGRPFLTLFGDGDRAALTQLMVFQGTEDVGDRRRRIEAQLATATGATAWTESVANPIFDPSSGRLEGVIVATRDIGARKDAEHRLRLSEAKLRQAQRLGQLGHWEFDGSTGRLVLSDHLHDLFELPRPPDGLSVAALLDRVPAADRRRLLRVIARIRGPGDADEAELRLVAAGGPDRWVRLIWQTVGPRAADRDDRANRAVDVFGVAQDITQRKLAEQEIVHSEEKLRTIFDNAADGIITTTGDGVIDSVNPAAVDIFGHAGADLIGRPIDALIPARFHGIHRRHLAKFAAGSRQAHQMGNWRRVFGVRKSGDEFPVMASIAKASAGGRKLLTVILRDMTETAARERALRRSREEAVAANQAKTRFLATMSHELRTPLNAVLGFSEIIRDQILGPLGNPKYVQHAENIHESGTHLLDLISDILDIARIEIGRVELTARPLPVAGLVETCLRLMEPQARRSHVTLTASLPPDPLTVFADLRAAKQILFNLLSNAVKFTKPGGGVTVRAMQLEGGATALTVIDTGIGIPEDQLERVRRPFERIESDDGALHEGAGLGLAIVDGLVRHHGGTVRIDSRLGAGTAVTVCFPPEHQSDLRQTGSAPEAIVIE